MLRRTPLKRGTKTLKRTQLKPRTPLKRAKHPLGAAKPKKTVNTTKTTKKGYKPPKWFTSIKPGSHGSTPAQKKLWRLVSETYRKEDFEKYGGKCVSCPTRLERWEDGQLAHYKAWSVCNSWFKYERKNLALSCPNCNRLSDGVIGHNFAEELKRRHGKNIHTWIETENLKYRGQKLEVWALVDKAAKLHPDLID